MSYTVGNLYAISDIGTILTYKKTDLPNAKYELLIGITGVGDLGGKRKEIVVTELHSKIQQVITGREETSTVTFDFNASNENLKRLNELKTKKDFMLLIANVCAYEFKGELSYSLEGVSADNAVKGKLTLSLNSKKEIIDLSNIGEKLEDTTKKLYEDAFR